MTPLPETRDGKEFTIYTFYSLGLLRDPTDEGKVYPFPPTPTTLRPPRSCRDGKGCRDQDVLVGGRYLVDLRSSLGRRWWRRCGRSGRGKGCSRLGRSRWCGGLGSGPVALSSKLKGPWCRGPKRPKIPYVSLGEESSGFKPSKFQSVPVSILDYKYFMNRPRGSCYRDSNYDNKMSTLMTPSLSPSPNGTQHVGHSPSYL